MARTTRRPGIKAVTPHGWTGTANWEVVKPETELRGKNAAWFTYQSAYRTFFTPTKVEKKANRKGNKKEDNN